MSEISKLLPLFLAGSELPPRGTPEPCVVESAAFDAVPIFAQGCIGDDDPQVIAAYLVQAANAFPGLVEALRPFAALALDLDKWGHPADSTCEHRIRAADIYAAREALIALQSAGVKP